MAMKVSVCTTTYNQERFIAQAVESALTQQTDFEYEVVIGEDCSTDRTRQILIELRDRHPDKIRLLLREENLGSHRNFVDTLKTCRGQYVAFLDGDDYWTSPHKLQKQVDFMDQHPDFALCGHRVEHIYEGLPPDCEGCTPPRNEAGTPRRGLVDYDVRYTPAQKEVGTLEDLLEDHHIPACSAFFRNGLISEFPAWFYKVRAGDWVLHVLNAQHGRVGFINEIMGTYRIHHDGMWSGATREARELGQIDLVRHLNRHFRYRYRRILARTLVAHYTRLSVVYEREGKLGMARGTLAKTIVTWPSPRWLRRESVVLILRLFSPRLLCFLQRLKRILLGGVREDSMGKREREG
ncbi:MAG: glycosyltransferase [Phycisphaerae bacterium]